MTDNDTKRLPIMALWASSSDVALQKFIEEALRRRSETIIDFQVALENIVNRNVRINGFRDPLRAPISRIAQALVKRCRSDPKVAQTVIESWVDCHPKLEHTMYRYLIEHDFPAFDRSVEFGELVGFWDFTCANDSVLAFRGAHPEFDPNGVSWMLQIVSRRGVFVEGMDAEGIDVLTASTSSVIQPTVRDRHVQWDEWLDILRRLPPTANEWDGAPVFVDQVRQLWEQRQTERSVQVRLRQALEALRLEDLSYFEVGEPSAWSVDDCPLSSGPEVTTWLEELCTLIDEHHRFPQLATTRSEQRERDRRRQDVEQQIVELCERIDRILRRDTDSDHVEPDADETQPPSEATQVSIGDRITEDIASTALESTGDEQNLDESAEKAACVTHEEPQGQATHSSNGTVDELTAKEDKIAVKNTRVDIDSVDAIDVTDVPEPEGGKHQGGEQSTDANNPVQIASGDDAATVLLRSQTDLCETDDELTLPREEHVTAPADDDDHALLWRFVASGDLAAAYWWARSDEARDISTPLPSRLLAATFGARWVQAGSQRWTRDLLEIGAQYVPSCENLPEALLGLAASLRPVLLVPYAGLRSWLQEPRGMSDLHDLITVVQRFADTGIALHPEDLRGAASREETLSAIAATVEQAEQWLQNADKSPNRFLYHGARDVWQHLVQSGGILRKMLTIVASNRREELNELRGMLDELETAPDILNLINRVRRSVPSKRIVNQPIVGAALGQLTRAVEDARDLAAEWQLASERLETIAQHGAWWGEQIQELRADLNRVIPTTAARLNEVEANGPSGAVAASARCLVHAIRQLAEDFDLSVETETPALADSMIAPLTAGNLQHVLQRRLLWLPEIDVNDEGAPLSKALPAIATALARSSVEERTPAMAFEAWLDQQDYRFIEKLQPLLIDDPSAETLTRRAHERARESRATLEQQLSHAREVIEQAMVDGILTEEDRAAYSGEVSGMDPHEVRNVGAAHDYLHGVIGKIEDRRTCRLEELKQHWDDLRQQFEHLHLDEPDMVAREEQITAQLRNRDVRLAEEFLSQLRRELDGAPPSEIWSSMPESRRDLEDFLKQSAELRERIQVGGELSRIRDQARLRRAVGPVNYGHFGQARREEVSQTVASWLDLKNRRAGHNRNAEQVENILKFLGLTSTREQPVHLEEHNAHTGTARFRATMTASTLSRPIPEFGSRTNDHYTIVCLWDRPGAETIGARFRDLQLTAEHVIVFYLGRLTQTQRAQITRLARDRELGIAILDETLLLYLAGEPGNNPRLPSFLRITLPFSAVNPYAPSGDVPIEMFFGREDMARDLQQPGGACLVYGGRQLGKSALLRHVRRQFHDPGSDRYAWIFDMKRVFDPQVGKGTDYLWRELRAELERCNVLSARSRAANPDTIAWQIRQLLDEGRGRRVLLLCDEADQFLDTDAREQQFREVLRLRELMDQTDRRFKVVFAGLHDVQRFQSIPNQPLAHFGTPLQIGPLEPRAAQQLIREPIEALGYRFHEPASVLRVLSYTNYHPGLIQLFCRELLKQLRQRNTGEPPYIIDREDIEAIYRNATVRNGIRERFEWTLNLDPRYHAIVLTMIEDQMQEGGGYARFYWAHEIHERAALWWNVAFADLPFDAYRGLLDELCGLGVLVRDDAGRYGLRSPNVVRLLGSGADIENKLLALEAQPLTPVHDFDSHHAVLDDKRALYSPLTMAQERLLNPMGFGVCLLFASGALGLDNLPAVFDHLIPVDAGVVEQIPRAVAEPGALDDWLRRFRDRQRNHKRLVAWQRIPATSIELIAGLIDNTLNYCARQRSQDSWMRVFFVLDPTVTATWLTLSAEQRDALESRADAVITVRRWNTAGVHARLIRTDRIGSDDVVRHVLEATSGWPMLLDRVLEPRGNDDPRPMADAITQQLHDTASQLAEAFRTQLGLLGHPFAEAILRYAAQFGGEALPLEFLTAAELGISAFTDAERTQAIEFLEKLGCVDIEAGGLLIDPVVRIVLTE